MGFYIVSSSNLTFSNNTALDNHNYGFYVYSSSNVKITNNTIIGSPDAIYVYNSSNITSFVNYIRNATGLGIYLASESEKERQRAELEQRYRDELGSLREQYENVKGDLERYGLSNVSAGIQSKLSDADEKIAAGDLDGAYSIMSSLSGEIDNAAREVKSRKRIVNETTALITSVNSSLSAFDVPYAFLFNPDVDGVKALLNNATAELYRNPSAAKSYAEQASEKLEAEKKRFDDSVFLASVAAGAAAIAVIVLVLVAAGVALLLKGRRH